jgi:hypothetical protein
MAAKSVLAVTWICLVAGVVCWCVRFVYVLYTP